jgi:hypothetical protein
MNAERPGSGEFMKMVWNQKIGADDESDKIHECFLPPGFIHIINNSFAMARLRN